MTETSSRRSTVRQKALSYCRVSDPKQKHTGHGLDSQAARNQQFAQFHGFEIEKTFYDDVTGGGDYKKRPAMTELLDHLKNNPGTRYVVLFDDIKRFSRDVYFYWGLIKELDQYHARPMSPNFVFEKTPEGRFQQSITVAAGEYERESNARQSRQKTQARMEEGYYAFIAPIGFKFTKERGQPKTFMRDEPVASVIAEMMEGYANGRFQTKQECRYFLEGSPLFPKGKSGKIGNNQVTKILTNPLYAGMIEYKPWGIKLREGRHKGMVSYETFCKIQERLKGRAYAPTRKDLKKDFPLRGAVACECGNSLTAAWSRSKSGALHPYYLCQNRQCTYKGKSIRRDVLEDSFAELLKSLSLADLKPAAEKMFRKLWDHQLQSQNARKEHLKAEQQSLNRQIEKMVDKIVEASSPIVVRGLEQRVEDMEKQKFLLNEKMQKTDKPKHTFEEMYRTSLDFLTNPYKYWALGGFAQKRAVIKLAFTDRLTWNRDGTYRTPSFSLPFKALEEITPSQKEMVPRRGIEPRTRGFSILCSTN